MDLIRVQFPSVLNSKLFFLFIGHESEALLTKAALFGRLVLPLPHPSVSAAHLIDKVVALARGRSSLHA